MTTGLASKFNILQQSPYDFAASPGRGTVPVAEAGAAASTWKPSRFNYRALASDGRLVLWNTLSGAMSVFPAGKREAIEALLRREGFASPERGIITQLVKNGFLIPGNVDEFRRFRYAFGQQHNRTDTLQLILLASEDCNFRCEYCYEEFARGTMEPGVREGIKAMVERRLGSLRHLSISWFGGEPLYGWPAIADLAPFFKEVAERKELSFSANMTTNGYLLTPDIAAQLLEWNVRAFQITLDGPEEYHDRSRPARNGEGTFRQIMDNLKSLRGQKEEFRIDLRVNFDRRNYGTIPEFMSFLEDELERDHRFRVRFRAVGQWGGPNDENLEVCSESETQEVQLAMKDEARRRGLGLTDTIAHLGGLGSEVCYAARPFNFIIGASGKVMKCTIDLDTKDRNVVGQLTEEGDLQLDWDKMALWTQPAFETDKKCQKCVVLPACQGNHCPQIRFDTGNSPCTPTRRTAKQDLLGVLNEAL